MKKILIALLVLVVMTMLVRCCNDDDVDNDIVIEKSCPPREINISQEIGEKKFSKPYVINDSLVKKGKVCPNCFSDDIARIVYGYVRLSDSLKIDLKRHREVLGGCCVRPEQFYCYKCRYKW